MADRWDYQNNRPAVIWLESDAPARWPLWVAVGLLVAGAAAGWLFWR